ncbi:MAG: hypothetical protein ACYCV7_10375 [Acidimicrobiales bacterium]
MPARFEEFRRRYLIELGQPERSHAPDHLAVLGKDRTLTLLATTRQPDIGETAVLSGVIDNRAPLPRSSQDEELR